MTLLFGSPADGRQPTLGASGAITAVLGAYLLLYPASRVLTWIFPVFVVHIPAWFFLGVWFFYQLIEADSGLFSASANGGGGRLLRPYRRVPLRPGSDLAAGQSRSGRTPGGIARLAPPPPAGTSASADRNGGQ